MSVVPIPLSAREEAAEARVRRKNRRNAIIGIALIDILVIAVGVSGAADLRRMSTPAGAAAAWADAAPARDCFTYLDLETPARAGADLAGVPPTAKVRDPRDGLCLRVETAWSTFTTTSSTVITAGKGRDIVRLTVTANGTSITGEVLMSHEGGRWRVDLPPTPCPTPSYSPSRSLCSAILLPPT